MLLWECKRGNQLSTLHEGQVRVRGDLAYLLSYTEQLIVEGYLEGFYPGKE